MNKFRKSEIESVGAEFHIKHERRLDLANKFEQQSNFSMAYLAHWSMIEDFAKSLVPLCGRIELEKAILQWSSYLSGEVEHKPKPISPRSFDFPNKKSKMIPSESLLLNVLNKDVSPSLFALLNPEAKYRKRRNEIAHSAEDTSMKVYEEFKKLMLIATNEIESWLLSASVGEPN
jgi:hypothetical protein